MQTWIILLRGLNVGGKNKLPISDLVAELEKIGLSNSTTYIQSGNVVAQGPKIPASDLSEQISDALFDSHGFRPHVLALTHRQFQHATDANPFQVDEKDGNTLHIFFLSERPTHPNEDALNAARSGRERWALIDDTFYLHAPDGFGRSKLAAGAEKWLGVNATARNWRTITRLVALADKIG